MSTPSWGFALSEVLDVYASYYGREPVGKVVTEWQDENRTYLTEERALDQRLDRKPRAAPPGEARGTPEVQDAYDNLVLRIARLAEQGMAHPQLLDAMAVDVETLWRASARGAAPTNATVEALECAEYALTHPDSDQQFALAAVRSALSSCGAAPSDTEVHRARRNRAAMPAMLAATLEDEMPDTLSEMDFHRLAQAITARLDVWPRELADPVLPGAAPGEPTDLQIEGLLWDIDHAVQNARISQPTGVSLVLKEWIPKVRELFASPASRGEPQ
jgi:hypothetical protein